MGKVKVRILISLLVLLTIMVFLWKSFFASKSALQTLEPSYIVAIRNNNLPLYGYVKGMSLNGDVYIKEPNDESQRIAIDFLKMPHKQESREVHNCLNMHIWEEICYTTLENLLYYPLFPALPTRRLTLPILDLLEIDMHSGIRIFGFLVPPKAGKFIFHLHLYNVVGHIWLSNDSKIENSKLLIDADFVTKSKLVSESIFLQKNHRYFIDIILKTGKKQGRFSLKWLLENDLTEPYEIEDIHLRPYFLEEDLSHTYLYPEYHFHLPMLKSRKFLSQLYTTKDSLSRFKSFEIDFMPQEDANDIFPYCEYDPSYIGKDFIKSQYRGVWETHLSSVYPNDQSNVTFQLRTASGKQIIFGNPLLSQEEAKAISRLVFQAIRKKHGLKYKFDSIINVELNSDPKKGKRYFVELKLLNDSGSFVRFSEYVFLPKFGKALCYPIDFQWNKTSVVNFILTCGKQGRWVKYFIQSLERLYKETKDRNFNVIIVDFNTNDIDVAKVLQESSLPHYTLLKRKGKFHKTIAIQSAANSIRNDDEITFQVDLHTTIPSNFLELARKHTIRGKMTWSPILTRLQCGATPQKPYGHWETSGYGIFAIFKSDWKKFGGMNVIKFLNKWGGEDWDLLDRVLNAGLEVERLKVVNFAHFFHSKKGMWHELT